MIKHEEVRAVLNTCKQTSVKVICELYVDEQEKKDELLGLYRDYFYALPDEAKLLREDIEALEEEKK